MEIEYGELLAREARHRVANELAVAAAALRLARAGRLDVEGYDAAIERIEAAGSLNAVLCRAPARGSVDLASELARLAGPLGRLTAAGGWTLVVEAPALAVAGADATRVSMIAAELVGNAVRHADGAQGRVVRIEVEDVGDAVHVSIADGGRCRTWSRAGGQGGGIVDALASAMSGRIMRGDAPGRPGAVVAVLPAIASRAAAPLIERTIS